VDAAQFRAMLLKTIGNRENPYHPFVWINGTPLIGEGTYIGGFSEINANGARVTIGRHCDFASFVVINVADSHRRCIGLSDANDCRDIVIGDCVFIGSQSCVFGGAEIGHHSVIGAGTIVRARSIPPFSLVVGNEVKAEYYRAEFEARHGGWDE
jgi:acetyltransferase-like isoleucine patch superfamily enzyme